MGDDDDDDKKTVQQVLFRWDQHKRAWVFNPGPASKRDLRLMRAAKNPERTALSRAGGKKRGEQQRAAVAAERKELKEKYNKLKKQKPHLSEKACAVWLDVTLKKLRKALERKSF